MTLYVVEMGFRTLILTVSDAGGTVSVWYIVAQLLFLSLLSGALELKG